jgi:uncharacterized protein YcbK (DUF882 family)
MTHYKAEHFILPELVDRETYLFYGDKAWEFLDPRLLYSLDSIWEMVNRTKRRRVFVNNWFWGGNRQWSGFRSTTCILGANNSPHRRGQAYDFIVEGLHAHEVRDRIISYQFCEGFQYITRMEHLKNDVPISWVHIDCVNIESDGIYLFNV